jgi:Flp pilus assembly protein TadG
LRKGHSTIADGKRGGQQPAQDVRRTAASRVSEGTVFKHDRRSIVRRRRDLFRRGARRGQSLVELALILPVLTLIMLGTIDLGRAFYDHNELTDAVKEGALYGIRYPSDESQIENRAYAESPRLMGGGGAFIIVVTYYTDMTATTGSGTYSATTTRAVEVTGTYAFRPITPMVRGLLPTNFKLRKSIRMGIL